MNTNAQVSKLEDLLVRVQKNRISMAEELAAEKIRTRITLLPVPSEPAPMFSEFETELEAPAKQPSLATITVETETTIAEPVIEQKSTPPKSEPAELELIIEPELIETEPIKPEPIELVPTQNKPIIKHEQTEESRTLKPQITTSSSISKTTGTPEKSWTLEAVLYRAWKLGG